MKDLSISRLIDLYGRLLSQAQLSKLQEYYDYDLSINEIAANTNLTRQGVYDSIRKSISILKELECSLQLIAKLDVLKSRLSCIDYSIVLDVLFSDTVVQ
ncbi:MAG: DNA-binding protein [Clostridiales bacterium]|jgi:predicted DNA-binding protein YlxM (UPF0122 family)|nr:DNA-binding protein [Clostridiales bacterium]